MRKLLLFFAMLTVSIGTWAAPKISGSGTVTLSGFQAGELKKALNGESVEGLTGPVENLKNATKIVFGDANLNDGDLSALTACTKATQYDMSSATLAEGATISSISAGPAIETVVLPNGLSKADVNAAGAALTTCNPLFGSCLSLDTEIGDKEVTRYYYTVGGVESEYTGNVSNLTDNGDGTYNYFVQNLVRDLTNAEGYPKCLYTNTEAYNAQFEVSADLVSDGTVTLSEFPVVFQNWDNKYKNPFTNEMVEVSPDDPRIFDGPNGNKFIMVDFSPNTKTFNAFTKYKYQYTDENGNIAYTQESDQPDEDMKIDINYNRNVVVTTRTGVESTGVVIAYVNTEGSLYKATALAGISASSNIKNVTISGKINNGDISWGGSSGSSDDPQGSQNDADKYDSNGAVPALVNHQGAPTSIDMSDAVIDNYRHLRVLNGWGASLESVVFPKTVTRIPNYCCYSMGNNGNKNLSEIVFPTEAATLEIGDYAFHHCAVTSLLFPSSTTSVGNYAFATAPNMTDVEMQGLTNKCTFGNNVFDGCGALKHVTLSEKTQNIGDNMFNQCGLLESIRIPTTCKTIGEKAFCECYSIHEVTIPEGVELIEVNAFELSGLTDIYVMATSPDKVPKIYAMSPTGDGPSTFSYQRTTGNNTAPNKTAGEWASADYDEVMSWYQDEMSGPKGLGTGNALAALHYPESMKPFYEGIDITKVYTTEELTQFVNNGLVNYFTPNQYLAFVTSAAQKAQIQGDITNRKVDGTTVTEYEATRLTDPVTHQELPLLYLPQTYAIDPYQNGSNPLQGPDKDNRYYPAQSDFVVRMAAGATGTNSGGTDGVASQWGWRQFPLSSSVEEIGEIPFQKEYDDTWYTMCFPWQMIDNQLFSAFNQKCEIVEFKGAEVFQDPKDEYNYSLVFHFDEVAKTYYTDSEGVEYDRERDGDKVDGAGHNLYIYTSKDGNNTVVSCPAEVLASGYDPKTASETVREQYGKYLSIQNVMVKPGHPYMIHPSIGAAPGNPATVYINGVKKIVPGEGLYQNYATLADVAESQKQEYTVTSKEAGSTAEAEAWKNPVTGKGGKYTFIGNINDAKDTDVEGREGAQDMPTENGPVYFLGLKDGNYPQFFKKPKGKGKGKWSQYSAIIVPDADAIANVEGLDGMSVGSGSGSGAKGFDVVFGEWEIVDEDQMATVIDNAVAEGKEKNEPAKIQHMNVVYNIKGQVVRSNSTSVEGLPKGLYIVNGKKYMVK